MQQKDVKEELQGLKEDMSVQQKDLEEEVKVQLQGLKEDIRTQLKDFKAEVHTGNR